ALRRRLVACDLTGEVDGIAVNDGLAHAGSNLVALDAHDGGPFEGDRSGAANHSTPGYPRTTSGNPDTNRTAKTMRRKSRRSTRVKSAMPMTSPSAAGTTKSAV